MLAQRVTGKPDLDNTVFYSCSSCKVWARERRGEEAVWRLRAANICPRALYSESCDAFRRRRSWSSSRHDSHLCEPFRESPFRAQKSLSYERVHESIVWRPFEPEPTAPTYGERHQSRFDYRSCHQRSAPVSCHALRPNPVPLAVVCPSGQSCAKDSSLSLQPYIASVPPGWPSCRDA